MDKNNSDMEDSKMSKPFGTFLEKKTAGICLKLNEEVSVVWITDNLMYFSHQRIIRNHRNSKYL